MQNLASYIDHTLLKADATPTEITNLCNEAKKYGFKSICVNPIYVSFAKYQLDESPIAVCCTVGFPLGATTSSTKAFEATECIEAGADEIDMVMAIGKLKAKDYTYVLNDINSVAEICAANQVICKVIIETALLTQDEKKKAVEICNQAQVEFVKTSTGFASGGATVPDVELLASIANGQIKASGGIKTRQQAESMIEAGATRLGMSNSVSLM